MDVRIGEVQSQVQVTDGQALLDPRILSEIVRVCVKAMKEEQIRDRHISEDIRLSAGISSDRH